MSERLRSMSDDDLGDALADARARVAADAGARARPSMAATRSERRPRVVRLPLSRPKRILLIAAATVLLLAGRRGRREDRHRSRRGRRGGHPERRGSLPTALDRSDRQSRSRSRRPAVLLGGGPRAPRAARPARRPVGGRASSRTSARSRGSRSPGSATGLPEISGTTVRSRPDGLRGRRQPGLEGDLRGHGRPASSRPSTGSTTTGPRATHVLAAAHRARESSTCAWTGNVLLWRDGPHTMRLETALPKAEAVRIADVGGNPLTPAGVAGASDEQEGSA